jgi:hypothetical protein
MILFDLRSTRFSETLIILFLCVIGTNQLKSTDYLQVQRPEVRSNKINVTAFVPKQSSCEVHLHYSFIVEMKQSIFEVANRIQLANFLGRQEHFIRIIERQNFTWARQVPSMEKVQMQEQAQQQTFSIKVEQEMG